MVEQLAFNQRVAGSSPARLTLNLILRAAEMVALSFVYSFIYRYNRTSTELGRQTDDQGTPLRPSLDGDILVVLGCQEVRGM